MLTILNFIRTKQPSKNTSTIALIVSVSLYASLSWSEPDSTENLLYQTRSQVQATAKTWKNFTEYRQTTRSQLKKFHTRNNFSSQRVRMNSPIELTAPKTCPQPVDGVLLIHGLNASPYFLAPIANDLNKQCFTVYLPLLAGHGTSPMDLLDIEFERWEKSISQFVSLLKNNTRHVYLGGVSLGGVLATSYALANPNTIKGLILFDPSFSISSLAAFGPIIRWFKPLWEGRPETNFIKYQSLVSNAAYQVYRVTQKIQKTLKHNPDIPTSMPKLLAYFTLPDSTIKAPESIEILYQLSNPKYRKIVIRTDASQQQQALKLKQKSMDIVILPAESKPHQVISLAHGAATIPPADGYLGQFGRYRDCVHYYPSRRYVDCLQEGAITIYAETSYDKLAQPTLFRRTTFNPFYDQVIQELLEFVKQK